MKTPEEIKRGLEYISTTNIARKVMLAKAGKVPYAYTEAAAADAIAYIQQLEAQAPKWISVEERLPEYGRYLVITRKGNAGPKVHTATYNHMGWWTHANFGDITHWMPLPDEPKEECDGETDGEADTGNGGPENSCVRAGKEPGPAGPGTGGGKRAR